jgi:hypothetical protein
MIMDNTPSTFYGTHFNMEFVKSCKTAKDLEKSQAELWLGLEDREARFKEVWDSVHPPTKAKS